MLGFDVRAAKVTWTVSCVLLSLYAVYLVRRTLFVLVLAVFFSYMLHPLVQRLDRYTPRRVSHTLSTAMVFGGLVLALAGVVALVGPMIADQAALLADQLPDLARQSNIIDRLPLPDWLIPYRDRIAQFVREHLQSGTAMALPLARELGRTLLQIAGNFVFVALVPVLAFLLIRDGAAMRRRYLQWAAGQRYASMWRGIVDDLDTLLGRYMRALLLLALATIVVYSLAFTLAGVPYSLVLATVAGVLEFVPVLGPLAAAVLCVAVAGLAGYDHLLLLIGFIAGYRLFQDYVLNPYLMSDGVRISPLLVLVGLLAGEELAGVAGVFLSVPVIAAAKILVLRIVQARRLRRDADPGTLQAAEALAGVPTTAPLPMPPKPPPVAAEPAAEAPPPEHAPDR